LVGEKEQSKFATIEELLGVPVTKGAVPTEFGPTPAYAPKIRSNKGFSRRR
jgi:hypothetical protein